MIETPVEYSPEGLRIAKAYERCLLTKCHHVSNDRYYALPFVLEPWQRENIWKPIFACGEMVDGRFERRFKRAIIGLPSGYGKTELAAAIVLTVATMEVIHNGQYGVVASSLDQVRNIFEKITTMIRMDADLAKQWEVQKTVIQHRETGAKIMVLPNKASALESWHFNVLVFDELHVYRDDGVWNAGIKGQKVLHNPLAIGITTAGDSRDGFLWSTLESCGDDAGMYVYWLGLDDRDDIEDPQAWEKLLVASWVTPESIEDQRNSATSKRSFERYTANRFPMAKTSRSCFKQSEIDRARRNSAPFDFDQRFTVGVDGAVSRDTFAIVAYQKTPDGRDSFREWCWDEPDESGYYPLPEIMDVLAELYRHRPLIAVDPARLTLMVQLLERERGVRTFGLAQNDKVMCPASQIFAESVHRGNACFADSPTLAIHASNVVEDERKAYGFRFTSTGSGRSKRFIDAAIAGAMAMYVWEMVDRPPTYEGGVFSFDL